MGEPRSLLITLTGHDRPGVTSALFDAVRGLDAEVSDIEQVVIRGRLVLGMVIAVGASEPALRKAIEATAASLGLLAEISDDSAAGPAPGVSSARTHVTVLGAPLRAAAIAAIAGRIADCGANIDRIVRIASYPVTAIELEVSGADPDQLRTLLAQQAAAARVDVAVQRAGLYRRAKRLVVMDVDSTLIQGEVIEMLAARAGCAREVAEMTEAAMRGRIDFDTSLRARVALLKGLDARSIDEVRESVVLAPGARTLVRTLKRLDYQIGLVSGGFAEVVEPIAGELGIDFVAANTLEIADGVITGAIVGTVLNRAGKAAALERFARLANVPLSQTVAVGDGANDLDMLEKAGLGVAFNAKPVVRAAADTAVSVPYLDAILYLLGISREEIETADREAALRAREA